MNAQVFRPSEQERWPVWFYCIDNPPPDLLWSPVFGKWRSFEGCVMTTVGSREVFAIALEDLAYERGGCVGQGLSELNILKEELSVW
jgi:hypothetical protein